MNAALKPLDQQVVVITGASSGIGLATAEAAAHRGAAVVLAARSLDTLQQLTQSLKGDGWRATAVECDVASREQVQRVAEAAVAQFGRIDTWINNAGLSIYGRLDEVSEEDSSRLFDINFWGVYHGCMAALPHLRKQGGAIINVGSEVSEAAIAYQGMYTASKHAVKGLTDALRIEIEQIDKAPVCITLIQPTAVDTPFPQHARNYMDKEARLPPPMIDPDQVAQAILHAAEHPTREVRVGTLSKMNTAIAKLAPGLSDRMAAKRAGQQLADQSPRDPMGALYRASQETMVVGQTRGLEVGV